MSSCTSVVQCRGDLLAGMPLDDSQNLQMVSSCKWSLPGCSRGIMKWKKKKNSIVVLTFSHYAVRQYCLARIFCSPLINLKGIHENPTEDLLYTPTFKNIIIIVSLNNAGTITQKHSRDCCCLIQQTDFWANKQSPEKIVWNVELYDSGAFSIKLHLWQTSLLADSKKITTSAPVWENHSRI